jgi:hypothetical protein
MFCHIRAACVVERIGKMLNSLEQLARRWAYARGAGSTNCLSISLESVHAYAHLMDF